MKQRTKRLVAVGLLVILGVAAFWAATEIGPLRGCRPIAPSMLPSGAAPGAGVEGVSGGAKQVIWGAGSDRVEQIVGLSWLGPDTTTIAATTVRGRPATLFRLEDSEQDGAEPAFTWTEEDCDRTVVLPVDMSDADASAFAAAY